MTLIAFLVGLIASTAGAICGIGGGVIIKPVLDLIGFADVSVISFLSGCTVLAMSCFSVVRSLQKKDLSVDTKTVLPLAVGAAIGGIVGHRLFVMIRDASGHANVIGAIQSAVLLLMTIGTLLYTLKKEKIKTRHLQNTWVCLFVGLGLGLISSFLGIGGGPINIVVLGYLFSMDSKVSAKNSLFIILCSQITNLITTLVTRSVPVFHPMMLLVMVIGGIGGGILGRSFNRKMKNSDVDKLFIILMIVIVLICIYNVIHYSFF